MWAVGNYRRATLAEKTCLKLSLGLNDPIRYGLWILSVSLTFPVSGTERVELLNGAHLLKIEAAQNECPPCVRPQTLPQYDQSHCKIEHMVKNAIIAYD